MRAVPGERHAMHQVALDGHLQRGQRIVERIRRYDLLGGEKGLAGSAAEPLVEEGVGAADARIAQYVRLVDMADRHIHGQRGHRHQFFAAIGRGDGLDFGVGGQHIRAESDAGGEERKTSRRRLETELKHALVEFHHFEGPGLARGAEMRFKGHQVHGDEAEDQFPDLARRRQHAHVRAAEAQQREVGNRGLEKFPHEGHGFAARAPAADADRHAAFDPVGDVADAAGLVDHAIPLIRGLKLSIASNPPA